MAVIIYQLEVVEPAPEETGATDAATGPNPAGGAGGVADVVAALRTATLRASRLTAD